MVDEPKPKAAKMKKRRRAPPEAFITYVVGIVGWDWGYARKKRGGHGRTTKLRGAKLVPGRRCTCMQSVERARESCFPVDTKPQSAHRRGSARTPTGEPMSGLLSPRLISCDEVRQGRSDGHFVRQAVVCGLYVRAGRRDAHAAGRDAARAIDVELIGRRRDRR
jgi:hypothetical protein